LTINILVCVDGRPHSKAAVEWAIRLGLALPAELTALHVVDPFLKKFYNELYSQGRKRYLEYVDERLQAEAEQVHEEFTGMCRAKGLETQFRFRHGEPLKEILEELSQTTPDLLITGAKQMSAWGRFRSRNLPLQLQKKAGSTTSILSVVGG
jgi:nucleotide-binding universal stress UspA family protein